MKIADALEGQSAANEMIFAYGSNILHRDYINLHVQGAEHFSLPDYLRQLREIDTAP
ncbi:MAG TPA: hypothetical protein VIW23_15320 [Candidatus Acidoferrum sp.]|jgi:hypothetical protein